uniref:Uncharacterized protein n=1 Tax=Anguilla anguilla TaxID=7936 RepID=A0A0E9WTW0_ANGAN
MSAYNLLYNSETIRTFTTVQQESRKSYRKSTSPALRYIMDPPV